MIADDRNYLRVRGEYNRLYKTIPEQMELPPRARRIHFEGEEIAPDDGTTSACAENTQCYWDLGGSDGNYLRVRGEYLFN